jgi:hypothetical protein
MGLACHTWQVVSLFWFFPIRRWKRESWNAACLGRGAAQAFKWLRMGPLVRGCHQKNIGLQRAMSERKVSPETSASQSTHKENPIAWRANPARRN